MGNGITVHMMVRNEEYFIRKSIESALGFADEIIVFDTGSTDATQKIVMEMKSGKIRFFEKGECSPKQLVEMRNTMIGLTKTPWFMIVDGDEIVEVKEPGKLGEKLGLLPENVHRVEFMMRDFVKDRYLAARERKMGKIWRTNAVKFVGEYPFEAGVPKKNEKAEIRSFSTGKLSGEAVSFHLCFFPRSSKDSDVKVGRHWRKLPFPVLLFFGPWPKGQGINGNILNALVKLPYYNLVGLFQHLLAKIK